MTRGPSGLAGGGFTTFDRKMKTPPTPAPISSTAHNPRMSGSEDFFLGTRLTSKCGNDGAGAPGKLLSPTVAPPPRWETCVASGSTVAVALGDIVDAS